MKIVMAKTAIDLLQPPLDVLPMEALSSQQVADACIRLLATRAKGTGGVIIIDRDGRPGVAFNTPRMAYGYVSPEGTFVLAP